MVERGVMFLKKLRFYEVLLIVMALLFFSVWATLEVTETAVFCGNTCHVMRHYYKDWKESAHNNVPCIDCHSQPAEDGYLMPRFSAMVQLGSYFTRTYGERTRAEVLDSSCLQQECHSTRLLEGQVSYGNGILFDHKPHMQQLRRGKIIKCTTCHAHVAMGDHITVAQSACFICHFKGFQDNPPTAQCTLCHDVPTRSVEYAGGAIDHTVFIEKDIDCRFCHIDIVQGTGDVILDKCTSCHRSTGTVTVSEPVESLHRRHVTDHKVECADCHSIIRHSLPETRIAFADGCGYCHRDRHGDILSLYKGTGAEDVEGDPSPMYLAGVECIACHQPSSDFSGDVMESSAPGMKASARACDPCHESGRGNMVSTWKQDIERVLKEVSGKLERTETTLSSSTGSEQEEGARNLLEKSRRNLDFVRASIPAHNYDYTVKILETINGDVETAISLTRQVKNGI